MDDWLTQAIRAQIKQTLDGYLKFEGKAYDAGPLLRVPLIRGYTAGRSCVTDLWRHGLIASHRHPLHAAEHEK